MQRQEFNSVSIWQHRPSGICFLCRKFIFESFKKHWPTCWEVQRLSIWQRITAQNLELDPEQVAYIQAGDHMRHFLHTLNFLLADGDRPLLEAGLVFISKWRYQERQYGNNKYKAIVLGTFTRHDVFLKTVSEHILTIFSHHGVSLPVILAIEDAFWALSRKIDFTIEENCWLLQWLAFSPWANDMLLAHIKEEFLTKFLPRGRPRKSLRILRKKLWELWMVCENYEYSVAPWTLELDMNLLRIARRFGSVEERVYEFLEFCCEHDLRWRSSEAVVTRMQVLGCGDQKVVEKEGEVEEDVENDWEIVRGREGCLEVFRSGRRASV